MMWTKQRRQRKLWCGWSSEGSVDKTGKHSERKMKLGNLPKMVWIVTLGASDNQVTSVTILNIAKIRIKNNMTFMVTDLPSRHKLHGHIRNMKRVRTNSALSNNKKDIKNKDEKNESYRRKHLNKDTKDKYLKKERKVVPR
jgi:hypothetical protein